MSFEHGAMPDTQGSQKSLTGKVLIAGLGLVGGSVAMSLAALENPPEVIAVDSDAQTIRDAVSGGLISRGFAPDSNEFARTLAEDDIELVILAMPVRFAPDILHDIASSGYGGIITDTASTKDEICREAAEILGSTPMYIPGHPMAGSEVNGLKGASKNMFAGKYWILCPDEHTDSQAFLTIHSLITSFGAKCISIDRNVHDEIMAAISHVPHLVASSLVELASRRSQNLGQDGDELFRLAAGGFKDSTRIAAGSASLWADIAMSNRDAVIDGISDMRQILADVESMLEAGDVESLEAFLDGASKVRRQIPSAWVPKSGKLYMLRVSMANHVGAVASVTSLAGRYGCNIHSIDIDHITDSTAVLEMVLTDEGDIESMAAELREDGFDVSLAAADDCTE